MRIALATCRGLPRGNEEFPPLIEALGRLGARAEAVIWDEGSVDWAGFDAVVIRGTWDYQMKLEAFLAWTEAVSEQTRLLNPATTVRWNTDKVYLRDLVAAGVPVVPTYWPERGLPELGDFVVKPSVSAGGMNAKRFDAGARDAAQVHADKIRAQGKTVMVQPYVASVDDRGETALLFFNGELSHSVSKGPLLARDGSKTPRFGQGAVAVRAAEPDEVAAAERALAAVPGDEALTYARVDLVRGDGGAPWVLEIELTEPALFITHADGAADRLAAAIAQKLSPQEPHVLVDEQHGDLAQAVRDG